MLIRLLLAWGESGHPHLLGISPDFKLRWLLLIERTSSALALSLKACQLCRP